MQNEIITLKNVVTYAEKSIVSKKILSGKNGNVTVFAFDKDESISPHKANFEALLYTIEGQVKVVIENEEFNLNEGEFIILPAEKTHSVYALEKVKFLLIMIKD